MTDKQIRPPYEIALMHDHILRLEEELKAKEEECKMLRGSNISILTTLELIMGSNKRLKAELEQETALKETYLACYKAKHDDIKGIFFKYKQTLNEIKNLCCEQNLKADFFACEILQKINEVIDE